MTHSYTPKEAMEAFYLDKKEKGNHEMDIQEAAPVMEEVVRFEDPSFTPVSAEAYQTIEDVASDAALDARPDASAVN